MNAQLLRRLFKAINEGRPALKRVAAEIVDEQKRQGHARLATQLEAVLEEQVEEAAESSSRPHGAAIRELRPLSQRQELMVTITRPEQLIFVQPVTGFHVASVHSMLEPRAISECSSIGGWRF